MLGIFKSKKHALSQEQIEAARKMGENIGKYPYVEKAIKKLHKEGNKHPKVFVSICLALATLPLAIGIYRMITPKETSDTSVITDVSHFRKATEGKQTSYDSINEVLYDSVKLMMSDLKTRRDSSLILINKGENMTHEDSIYLATSITIFKNLNNETQGTHQPN